MKKIICLLMTVVLLAASATCAALAVGLPNPITEYSSLDEINELLGCHLAAPAVMGVADEGYRVISTGGIFDIGEYCFTVNGMHYCYRFCADYDSDISGVWLNGEPAFEGQVRENEYAAGDGKKLIRWANVDGQYVLCVTDNDAMEQEQFEGIAAEIMQSSMPEEDNTPSQMGGIIDGTYADTYSQRAYAEVSSVSDGAYSIAVSWADSAFQVYKWEMQASLGEDGLLYYNDCKNTLVTYEDENTYTAETIFENGEGFFSVNGDTLYWNGAAEESCRECAFKFAN